MSETISERAARLLAEKLNLDFGPRGDYENPRQPSAPIEATGAGDATGVGEAP